MANSRQAAKRARQAEASRQLNMGQRSRYRTLIKAVLKAVAAGDKEGAKSAWSQCEPVLDRYASRGLLHKNKAARHKTRINARIKALA